VTDIYLGQIEKSGMNNEFSPHEGGHMRKLLLLSLALICQQGLACVSVSNSYICNGDTVFKGTHYKQGATVVADNPYSQQVTVRSNFSGNLAVENVADLDITRGCFGQICVGQKIFKGASYSQGANVVGINYSRQSITVRSVFSSNLAVENAYDLESTTGCVGSVCIGEIVYRGTQYSQGARIESINFSNSRVTVRSVFSGDLAQESLDDLFLAKGCLGTVCVNDHVFKGTSYSQGANVVAINTSTYRAVVRSVFSGNLSDDSIYELQNGSNQPWPTPVPPKRVPPMPVPRPSQRVEVCTVSRLDPSGMFITSYNSSGNSRSEACRNATFQCSRELKGRQTCNIAR
jgi:hypothetical protein